jgi:hypothetical protein
VLAIHAVPHPHPKVRRLGFTLEDPYVEQVWAGVIGQSALLVLRRLPVLWREREPAVVDLREHLDDGPLGTRISTGGSPSAAMRAPKWRRCTPGTTPAATPVQPYYRTYDRGRTRTLAPRASRRHGS